ncbi:MAG: hypothetical protein KF868_03710 [Acidobacteria bacterium]|nr:hypothetical protein [Acidobacteriota bacterium]MCW5971115.1 hypothetical protein [Blastocatellales bacterium]
MKRLNRREMVLEIYDREAMGEVTAREIAIINRGLVAEYGQGGLLDPAEIARILIDEDLPVRLEQIFNMSSVEEGYTAVLEGVLRIDSLAAAERSLRRIDAICRRFEQRGDRRGARRTKELATRGRLLALNRSRDKRIKAAERRELAEIAEWFGVWLRTPDLFETWLDLRKLTTEFRRTFGEKEQE